MTETTDQAARRNRYDAAIREAEGWVLDDGQHMLDAVIAVADAEQAELCKQNRASLRRADEAGARAAAMERAMESTAADALKHRGCHRDLMGQCLRAERAEAAIERVRSVLESEAVVGRSALDYRGLITSALMADEAQQPETPTSWTPGPVAVARAAAWAQQPETQQGPPRPPSPRCAHCRHPKRDHDGRADHRANSSPLVAGDPWCHACNAECDYAEQSDFQERGDTARRAAGIDGTAGDAQDVPHAFVLDEPTGGCLLCGLSPTYRKHAVVSQPGKEA